MSEPKLGMYYDAAKKKLRGPLGKQPRIRASILNQVRIAEGEKAKLELDKELCSTKPCSRSFTGAGNKQIVGVCLRRCANRDRCCDDCVRFSAFRELETLEDSAILINAGEGGL